MLFVARNGNLIKELEDAGYIGKQIQNPAFRPCRGMMFDLDKKGAAIVADWMEQKGLTVDTPKGFYRRELLVEWRRFLIERAMRVSAKQIAEKFIPDHMKGNRCDCRACKGHNSIIFTDNGRFYCQRCGRSGTGIGFVMLAGIDSTRAAKMICDEFGV